MVNKAIEMLQRMLFFLFQLIQVFVDFHVCRYIMKSDAILIEWNFYYYRVSIVRIEVITSYKNIAAVFHYDKQ